MAILTQKGWVGFASGTREIIITDFFSLLKKSQPKIDKMATETVKEQFGLFNPPINYDNDPGKSTGLTKADTKAYSFFGDKNLVIRFKTPNNRPSRDGQLRGYAVFSLLGLSTSKKYGERNWLKKGAEKTFEKIANSEF
jgi:hypothetical protein